MVLTPVRTGDIEMDEKWEGTQQPKVPWLAVFAAAQFLALAILGWLVLDTRATVDRIWSDMPSPLLSPDDAPPWASRVEQSAEEAAMEARRAAIAADDAKESAKAACKAASEYGFGCR